MRALLGGASRCAATMVVVVLALCLTSGTARAHASLDSSSPGAFAVLEQSPTEVRLRFSEAPQAGLSTLRLLDARPREVTLGPVEVDPDDSRSITASVPQLPDGLYVVVWSVASADGHRVTGSFAFSVGVAAAEEARDLLARVAAGERVGDTGLDTLVTATRALGFVALALVVGGAWLRYGPPTGRAGGRHLEAMIWVGWVWSVTAAISLVPLQAAQVTGGTLRSVLDRDRWGQLLDARQGQALVGRLAVLALVAWWLSRPSGPSGRRMRNALGVSLALGLAVSNAVAGHAVTATWAWLAVAVTSVHLVAVTAWLGVVAGLALGARHWEGGSGAALATASPLARVAAPVAVASGLAAAVLIGPSFDTLLDTSWGRWLAVKVVLVAALLALGWRLGRRARGADAAWRPRLAVAEMAVGLVTLVVAAALVSTPPTTPAAIEPVTETLVQAGVLAEVTVTPARAGSNELHLVMTPPGGSLQPIGQLTARLTAVGSGVPPFAVELAVAGPNHWTAPVQFPYPGRWQLEVVAEVRPLELVQFRVEFDVNR